MAEKLEDIQDQILERLHAGETIDRDALLAQNPEHEEALQGFFSVLQLIEGSEPTTEAAPTRLGEFRILREISRGGMGVVYEAEQASLKRRVALKVLSPALRSDPLLLARFRREAEAAGRLRHPNVVPVYSIGEAGGVPFFAMELVEGKSLQELLDAQRKNNLESAASESGDWRQSLSIVIQVADALSYAHSQRILHRDIKPGNILIDEQGTARLTDFGLALDMEASSLTVSGEIFGSPRYMSPEQAFRNKKPLDSRTDVYSLAVTLYEMLSLRLPYDGESSTELFAALSQGKTVPLRDVAPAVPSTLQTVIDRALRRDPGDRYQSVQEFADDLRLILDGQTVSPRRKRRPVLIGACVLLVVSLGFAAYQITREDSAPLVKKSLLGQTVPSDVPTREDLDQLVAGKHPLAREVLERWLEPIVQVRSILSRTESSEGRMDLGFRHPPDAPPKMVMLYKCERRVENGPWQATTNHRSALPIVSAPGSSRTIHFSSYDFADTLEQYPDASSLELDHRFQFKIALLPKHKSADGLHYDDINGGTELSIDLPSQTCLVYEQYPADFPTILSDPETNAKMRNSFTPAGAKFRKISNVGSEQRSILMTLGFGQQCGPVPFAMTIELIDPYRDLPIARTEYAVEQTYIDYPELKDCPAEVSLHFALLEAPNEEEARFLLALQSGEEETVTFRFTPSREVAIDQPGLMEYWGISMQVEVPLAR